VALVDKTVQEMQAARGELLVHQTAVAVQMEAAVAVAHLVEQAGMEVVRLFGQIFLEIPMLLALAAAVVMPPMEVKLVALALVVVAR
jgi:hypothetical protein